MNENDDAVVSDGKSPLRLKTPLSVWVLYCDEEFKFHISRELVNCLGIEFELYPLNKTSSTMFNGSMLPDLLFVQAGDGWAERIAQLQKADVTHHEHDMALIVLGKESDNQSLRLALRLGASDYLAENVSAAELMPVFVSIADQKLTSTSLADLYVFTNTKGGTGATTICLNSAVEMALHGDQKVLYLDLDMHFGVANDYLNLKPNYSISDAIDAGDDLDEVSLQALVTKHPSGLHLLSFDPDHHVENFEKAKKIAGLIPLLRKYYRYIFVDLSTGVDRMFAPVITQSTRFILVTQQHLAALKNTSRIVRLLKYEYGIPVDAMVLIVNRYDKRQQIKLSDIESSLVGIQQVVIPNDYKVAVESTNMGEPFVMSKPNSIISRAIQEFCHYLSPYAVEQEKGWLERLFHS